MLTGSSAAFLTKTAIGQDRRANTLRFVPVANLSVLDPVLSSGPVSALHGNYVFDTLYAVDGSLTSRPQMASGHEVSNDGRTWRIRLRDGLTFHEPFQRWPLFRLTPVLDFHAPL